MCAVDDSAHRCKNMRDVSSYDTQTSHLGNVWGNLGRQLVDGHWVLAFPSPERAWHAKQLLDQHTARLRAFYCDIMSACHHDS